MDSATISAEPQIPGHLVVMGVAGCGKSSLGQAVAAHLAWLLIEGDDYHAPESLRKMREGVALTDADREGWLDRLAALLRQQRGAVLTCSALKRAYRERLRVAVPGLRFAYLEVDLPTALARVAARPGHIFPPSLVASQFETLEDPSDEPGVLRVDACAPLNELGDRVARWLTLPVTQELNP